MNVRRRIVLLLAATLAALSALPAQNPQAKRAPRPRAEGPLVRIPASVAGNQGVVVRLVLPNQPRYAEEAPVVIHVPGGWSRGSLDSSPGGLAAYGFVEVLFAFPGGKSARQRDGKVWKSGGTYDYRGENCVRALAAVMLFAQGRLRTLDGKSIQQVAGAVPVSSENVGVIGWSLGGNIVPAALARGAEAAAGIKWYASHESPYGDGVINGEFGTRGTGANPFYDPGTGQLDLSNLAYDPGLAPGRIPRTQDPVGNVTGSLYHDADGDGRYNPDADYQLNGILIPGPRPNVFYSRLVTAAAVRRKVFGGDWPAHIAKPPRVEELLAIRDGETQVAEAVKNSSGLAVIIWAVEQDHVQATKDHRHIRIQYDAYREAGVRWARVNPDAHYLEWAMRKKPSRSVQNPAGKKFSAQSIRQAVEPAARNGGGSNAQGLAAAASELADRTQKDDWRPVLDQVLYPDSPRPPARNRPARASAGN